MPEFRIQNIGGRSLLIRITNPKERFFKLAYSYTQLVFFLIELTIVQIKIKTVIKEKTLPVKSPQTT